MGVPSALAAPPVLLPIAAATAGQVELRPVIGQERTYRVRSTGTASVNLEAIAQHISPDGKQTQGTLREHTFEVSATLGTRVVGRDGDDWLVAMRIEDAKYIVGGIPEDRAARLATTFLVRMSPRGAIRSVQFPVKYPNEAATAIRAIVDQLQVVIAAGPEQSWTVGEKTLAGASTVQYAIQGVDAAAGIARLSRTVTAARPSLRALDGMGSTVRTAVDASSGQIEWALDGSGPQLIEIRERTTSMIGARKVSTSDQVFTATAVSQAVSGLPTSPEELQEQLRDETHARAAFYVVHPHFAKTLEGATFEQISDLYFERVGSDSSTAVNVMKFALRKWPDRVSDFVRSLDGKSRGTQTDALRDAIGYGYAAVAAAGHREAQTALVGVLNEASYTALSQEKALDAMLSLEMPERFVPNAVWRFREKLPQSGTAQDNEKLSIATNIYGQLGNVELGVEANTKEVIDNLSGLLRRSREEKRRALVALGNVSDASLTLPLTTPYFGVNDEFLRLRAYDTFMRAKGENAFKKFAAYYGQEKSQLVRQEASVVAMSMEETPARNAWAAEQARVSPDPVVRTRAVEILGHAMRAYPENEQVLRGLLEEVRDRDVRRTIYRFVSPAPRGAR